MPEATIPLRLGRYSIVEQIGVGASSNVYLAIEDKSFISVAIKQLRPSGKLEAFKRLLAHEVELASKLHHKNIVRFINADMNEKSGAYTVMEYIKGVSLDRHQHTESLLPINKVLAIIEQVANALQYAASQHVVHRDVKPENILLMPNGMTKLTDFGCAIATGEHGAMVAGSLAYMSPEQLDGLPLDERADIYSLGAALYRLLTGKNTFTADNEFDARIAVLNYPAQPIRSYRPELPDKLVEVIQRALYKDVERRYPNWETFIQAFGNAAHEVRMSHIDYDVYRGFSPTTQRRISDQLSATGRFSLSDLSRSIMPRE